MEHKSTGSIVTLFLVSLLVCLLSTGILVAQQVQEFTGRVTDPTGAVVPRASILAHNLDTGVDKSTITTSTGDYT